MPSFFWRHSSRNIDPPCPAPAPSLYLSSDIKQYRSASAFAPIANPINAPWGKKAFSGYLQNGIEEAKPTYDATELIAQYKGSVHILVDYASYCIIVIAFILLTSGLWVRSTGYWR